MIVENNLLCSRLKLSPFYRDTEVFSLQLAGLNKSPWEPGSVDELIVSAYIFLFLAVPQSVRQHSSMVVRFSYTLTSPFPPSTQCNVHHFTIPFPVPTPLPLHFILFSLVSCIVSAFP
jgi:hypothetical protein